MRFDLKDFQIDAVREMLRECRSARRDAVDGRPQAIILSSPTGSGKTVMMVDLMEKIWKGHDGTVGDPDAVFLWLSDMPELNEQSRQKIDQASEVFKPSQLVPIENSMDEERLKPGRIYFLNTQKLGAKSLLVQSGDKRTWTIWETIENTIKARPQSFYLIIDEAHRGMRNGGKSAAAETKRENARMSIVQRFISGYETEDDRGRTIKMRPTPIIIGMSATPERFTNVLKGARRTQRPVDVPWDAVQESGLIKDRIILDIADDDQPGDWALLEQAGRKLVEYSKEWQAHCKASSLEKGIRPVLVVQVENGTEKLLTKTDMSRVVKVLDRGMNGIASGSLAHCMQEDTALTIGSHIIRKVELSAIQDDPTIRVVFFKTALTTGWDCPRAEVMMSFRKAQDSTLIAQLVGRMVRTPLARRIENNDMLNSVWLALPHYDERSVKDIVEKLESADSGTPVKVETKGDIVEYRPNPELADCFEALAKLPTYRVERPSRIRGTHRIMRLARRLNWNNIYKNAISDAKKLIMAELEKQRDRLKQDPEFSKKVTGKAKINIREFVIEYGEWKEEYESREFLIEATPENIDDMFEQCYGILGEGINELYVKTLFTAEEDMIGKLELFCIVQNKAAFDSVQKACDGQVEKWLREYAEEIRALPEEERAKFDDVRRRGPDPAEETMKPQENIQVRKESPKWDHHLYIDDNGKFGWKPGRWEELALKLAMKEKGFVGWLRNIPRRPGSLCVPYGRGEKKPLYPDLLVFRREKGKIKADILDPHGEFLGDAPDKAAGLAAFARKHGEHFGRIELIRVKNDDILRLPLHEESVARKVGSVTDKAHLNDLFEQFGVR